MNISSSLRFSHRAMRLAMVTETYPPEVNGVALTIDRFVRSLRARGHTVELIRPGQKGETKESPTFSRDVLVPSLPLPGYPGLRLGLPLGRDLRRRWVEARPDVVHIATEGPLGWSALRAARAMNIPVVAGFHTQFHRYSQHYGVGMLEPLIEAWLRYFHNRAHLNLAPTLSLQAELSERGFRHVEVLGRGVDTALFSPARRSSELRRAWGVPDDGLAVLYVGRMAHEKNLELLQKTFAAIQKIHVGARLILVGNGPAEADLRAAHPEYIFCGARLGEDLATHYASADVFLFPSLTETFGNVLLEAMASSLVTVAFDYAAAAEHVQDGVNGFKAAYGSEALFIEVAQRACRASNQGGLRSLAREQALSVSWDTVLTGLEGYYAAVLAAEPSCIR